MITIINSILIIFVFQHLLKQAKYHQLIIFTLPIAFNYSPVVFIQFANIEISQFQRGITILHYCVLAWNIGFLLQTFIDAILTKTKYPNPIIRTQESKAKLKAIIPIIAICLSINVISNNIYNLFIILENGYHAIYTKDADLFLKTTTILPLYIWFNSLLLAYKTNQPKNDVEKKKIVKFSIWIYWASIITFIFSGSRSTVIYLLFTIICITYSGRALSLAKLLVPAISAISLISLIGIVREGQNISGSTDLLSKTINELAQTTLVFINSIEVINFDLSRYIHLITTIFPQTIMNSIGITPPISLAQQYVELVDPGWAQAGGGFGFSIFAEMYIAGGLIFVVLGSSVIANISSYINRIYAEKCNNSAIASCSAISFYLYTLARGDSYDLYRPVAFAIAIYYVSKIRICIKKSSSTNISNFRTINGNY